MVKTKRLLAAMIDYFIMGMVVLIPQFLIIGMETNMTQPLFNSFFASIILVILSKDLIFKGASIGKSIFKLEIKNMDGTVPNILILMLRNVFLILWPVELILVLICNKRIGDMIFNTRVIDSCHVSSKGKVRRSIVVLVLVITLFFFLHLLNYNIKKISKKVQTEVSTHAII